MRSIMARVCLVLATLLLHLAIGEDLYWIPNSNWDNAGNWKLNRVPCGGDIASFASVPAGSLIYVNTNVTVRSIVLPRNGKLLLKSSVSIHFTDEPKCTSDRVPGEVVPDGQKNEFIGAKNHYWECASNWITGDNLPAAGPPCQSDRAIFSDDSTYSFVSSNETVTVRSLTLRGVELDSLSSVTSAEFQQLKLRIEPRCEATPTLCPCPSTGGCTDNPEIGPEGLGGGSSGSSGGVVAGVVVVVIVVLVIAILGVVVGLLFYRKYKQKRMMSYNKDELNDEEEENKYTSTTDPGSVAFNNPVYGAPTDAEDIGLVSSDTIGVDIDVEGGGSDFKEDLGSYSVS